MTKIIRQSAPKSDDRPAISTTEQGAKHTPGQRYEFQMTPDDLKALLEACRSVPLIALQCGMPPSPQESANRAWCALGDRMGFDGMTVEPSAKGQTFFTAIAKATGAAS